MKCKRCNGEMKPGKAIEQTYTGIPDFIGGDVVTMSPGGPGRLIDCLKCVECGWSVTASKTRSQRMRELGFTRRESLLNIKD